jgi:hypothetical protein
MNRNSQNSVAQKIRRSEWSCPRVSYMYHGRVDAIKRGKNGTKEIHDVHKILPVSR